MPSTAPGVRQRVERRELRSRLEELDTAGELTVTIGGRKHVMRPGGFGFIPPASDWSVRNETGEPARFHWIRKTYDFVDGIAAVLRPQRVRNVIAWGIRRSLPLLPAFLGFVPATTCVPYSRFNGP